MKREQFLQELRKLARDQGVEFEVLENQGKGSHYRIKFNGIKTTLKSGEITPQTARLIKKQLGII